MVKYTPLKITGMTTGLVQEREEFILPNDAYPVLENAYVWRERIKRKQGASFLGRLQRVIALFGIGNFGAGPQPTYTGNLFALAGIVDVGATVSPGSVSVGTGGYTWVDSNTDGRLITTTTSLGGYNGPITGITLGNPTILAFVTAGATFNAGDIVYLSGIQGTTELNDQYFTVISEVAGVSVTINATTTNAYVSGGYLQFSPGTVNYNTSVLTMTVNVGFAGIAITGTFGYNPNLPVMGILSRELNNENNEETIFFDQKYAYKYVSGFQEYITGTTWTGTDYNFFWGTNYWVSAANVKLFWVTNFSGTGGDPIRYTDGTTWTNFAPAINNAGTTFLNQCLALLPFRGRLLAFRTLEGANLAGSLEYFQRIRWANIGSPLTADAWVDDVRGKGGFLDIPTSQAIMSVGFVRDNLVIYCERSTWQLRYTGRSISPFQIEKVNAELGTESTFSAIQFDTSLVGIGDKGIVQCDSFKSDRIDIKIPDLVFDFHNISNGNKRVYGVRDFEKRLGYWIYPYTQDNDTNGNYPNRRLVYNYENDSWAIFIDSFTALGTFQQQTAKTWAQTTIPWEQANYQWIGRPALFPDIVAGNQQGYVMTLDQQVSNDQSLFISNITGSATVAVIITSPNHNLQTGQIIQIIDIPETSDFGDLNNGIFKINRIDANNFDIYQFNSTSGQFDIPFIDPGPTFAGTGQIKVRDNFSIQSKKFNFLEQGENIQLGFLDILMDNTSEGAITLNVYGDYNTNNPLNTAPENLNDTTGLPDTFFNSVIPTNVPVQRGSVKNWQRVFCATRASFLTTEFTLSNAQMNGVEQQSDVQIDAQIMWVRKCGRQLPIGV